MSENGNSNGRDGRGRFAEGNAGGPGGSRRHSFELRRAAEGAIEPEHMVAVMRRALRMALEGNMAAMRFVADRACGRVAELPREPESISVDFPPLREVADCAEASGRVVDGIVDGAIDHDTGKLLLDAIQTRLKAIEMSEHEQRLAALEQFAQHTTGSKQP